MSGRKSSEVSSLLSLGKRSRDEINRNLNSEINQNISKNENFLRKLENVENEVNAVNLSIDTQISDEVSKGELNNILNKLKLEKDKIKNTKLENFSDELNKKRMIEEEFVSLDKRTAEIERIIQNKWDYCDSEYSEANSIASRYEKGKKQLSSLGVQISNKLQKNMENMLGVDTAYRNIQSLEKEFRLKTKNIINTNNLAYINDVFDTIDKNIAKKFMMSEFNILKTEIKNLNQSCLRRSIKITYADLSIRRASRQKSLEINHAVRVFPLLNKIAVGTCENCFSCLTHQLKQEVNIVHRKQLSAQHLVLFYQVIDVCTRISARTDRTGALGINRACICKVLCVLKVHAALVRKRCAHTSSTRWKHAVKHINTTSNTADKRGRITNAHQVARLIARHVIGAKWRQRLKHNLVRLSNGIATNAITGEIANGLKVLNGAPAQIKVHATLNNAKERLIRTGMSLKAPFGPCA